MAIKFGKDGTLFCNTIKYNYKQARNLISDGSYGNMSESWLTDMASGTPISSTNYANNDGYKSYRCFVVKHNEAIYQPLQNIYKNRKYYISCRYKVNNHNCSAKLFFSSPNISGSYSFASEELMISENFDGEWNFASNLFEITPSVENVPSLEAYVCVSSVNANESMIGKFCRFIMVDLTDTFGAGNEPDKNWCDKNIREHEVFVNWGCVSNHVTKTNIATRYTISNADSVGPFNYLTLPGNWEPREYMYMLKAKADVAEGYVCSQSSFELDNTKKYYAYIEYHKPYGDELTNQNLNFYFPNGNLMGQVPIVLNKHFNGGGGMWEWKRASVFSSREQCSAGSYQFVIGFNNANATNEIRLTAINLLKVDSNIAEYNKYNNSSIVLNDVNKEWCDRWIDGRLSLIHI